MIFRASLKLFLIKFSARQAVVDYRKELNKLKKIVHESHEKTRKGKKAEFILPLLDLLLFVFDRVFSSPSWTMVLTWF